MRPDANVGNTQLIIHPSRFLHKHLAEKRRRATCPSVSRQGGYIQEVPLL